MATLADNLPTAGLCLRQTYCLSNADFCPLQGYVPGKPIVCPRQIFCPLQGYIQGKPIVCPRRMATLADTLPTARLWPHWQIICSQLGYVPHRAATWVAPTWTGTIIFTFRIYNLCTTLRATSCTTWVNTFIIIH